MTEGNGHSRVRYSLPARTSTFSMSCLAAPRSLTRTAPARNLPVCWTTTAPYSGSTASRTSGRRLVHANVVAPGLEIGLVLIEGRARGIGGLLQHEKDLRLVATQDRVRDEAATEKSYPSRLEAIYRSLFFTTAGTRNASSSWDVPCSAEILRYGLAAGEQHILADGRCAVTWSRTRYRS